MKIQKNIDFLIIAGPTAVGKSALGIELAKKYNGEIINGDSVQVYKKMDIGSAKLDKSEMQNIKHHMIDIKDPKDRYSVYDFQKGALKLINEIKSQGKLPIIVGGSGLYLNSLIYEYKTLEEINRNSEVYKSLVDKTNLEIYNLILSRCEYENIEIHVNNRKRNINYAYKILMGYSLKEKQEQKKPRNCQVIVLTEDRKILYNRIDMRVNKMIEDGLVEEVKQFQSTWPSQTAIGYKEIHKYLFGEISKDEAIILIKKNTRNYAKRQLTWFKNKVDGQWYIKKDGKWQQLMMK